LVQKLKIMIAQPTPHMNSVSAKFKSLLVFLIAGGIFLFWNMRERQLRFAVQAENEVLRADRAKAETLVEELSNQLEKTKALAETLQNQSKELPKLRGEVTRLRAQSLAVVSNASVHTTPRTRTSSRDSAEPDPENLLRTTTFETWTFAGSSTPENTLQSVAWAMTHGDLQSLLAVADPGMQERLRGTVEGKTKEETTEFVRETGRNLAQVHLKEKKMISDDEVKFTVTGERLDGHSFDAKLTMRRIGNPWKYVDR
jgi:hypothetical protein